ncbi:hypothetical protein pipiens_000010, partial [Culex pipiens pipiens]
SPGTSAGADIAGVFYEGIGKIFGSTTRCKIRHKDGPVAIAGICDQETDDLQSEPEITPLLGHCGGLCCFEVDRAVKVLDETTTVKKRQVVTLVESDHGDHEEALALR